MNKFKEFGTKSKPAIRENWKTSNDSLSLWWCHVHAIIFNLYITRKKFSIDHGKTNTKPIINQSDKVLSQSQTIVVKPKSEQFPDYLWHSIENCSFNSSSVIYYFATQVCSLEHQYIKGNNLALWVQIPCREPANTIFGIHKIWVWVIKIPWNKIII